MPTPMPLTLTPTRHSPRGGPHPGSAAVEAVVLLVALAVGAVLGWHLGVASPDGQASATRPAAATTATPGPAAAAAGAPAPGTGHAALVTLTPTTGVTGLAHLDRPLTAARVHWLATRTALGIVTLTTDLGGGHGEAGTGIVLTPTGEVLTNAHVIAGYRHTPIGDTISAVDLADGHTYPVTALARDRAHDIALVHLEGAHDLPVARIGDSRELHPGEQLASLGNAYGRGELAIGAGPLTSTGQTIASTTGQTRPLTGLLQVHNGIVPGQSGGPLIDRDARVVGINVAYLAGPDHTPTGDGYAIPIRVALHAAQHLIRSHPEYTHPRHRGHSQRGHLTHHITHRGFSQVA